MKKTSINFADHQAAELSEHAAHRGLRFAELVRQALDEWLTAHRVGRPMTPAPQAGTTVYVHLRDENFLQTFLNAVVVEQASSPYRAEPHRLMVMRGDDMLSELAKVI